MPGEIALQSNITPSGLFFVRLVSLSRGSGAIRFVLEFLESVLPFFDTLLELTHASPDSAHQLRDLRSSKEEQDDDDDDNQFRAAQAEGEELVEGAPRKTHIPIIRAGPCGRSPRAEGKPAGEQRRIGAVAQSERRRLPSVHALLEHAALTDLPRPIALRAVRETLDRLRKNDGAPPKDEEIVEIAAERAASLLKPSFQSAVNATGTILNTGLGRARLAKSAAEAAARAAGEHTTLEIDLESGTRGDRQKALRRLLCDLTGAESAYVVNNNAAAVLLAIHTLAQGREVLLSRGQSVEIGGSFRMPDVVRAAGATLVDVGCTNKTRTTDYEVACSTNTAVLLRCHPSNFALVGFVEEPTVEELADVAARHGLALVDDVGSGCLIDTTKFGLPHEPTLIDSLRGGAHLVTASGDKLLGGPQAGIILGNLELISRIARNPLARVLRVDKVTCAALEATLKLYQSGRESEIPTIRYLARTEAEISSLASKLAQKLKRAGVAAEVTEGWCEPGGGSLPGVRLPSRRVTLRAKHVDDFAKKLRLGPHPVIGYTEGGAHHLDMRTVEPEEIPIVERAVAEAWS
ncbi:MAG: L-seryl-tRNA(Sec) selenium transferase [Armatimonadetes bacterium ATM1]|nr:MAG: L-seryl-tRNA(Sec) selenium transferase [Armatimonadota bacterium]MBC6969487.1 L-seryl-tRNA(Sec) selenium transferase [Armatimonadota bacterium]MCE7899175.1 L-seryl-tRNA(Sec) selenium transferase [Armatimonadetes bacterium ATM1]RIJ97242.1 MAG: L-seryl-tRNA(Sec) selenium transferase [Armatimonadota bacterium]